MVLLQSSNLLSLLLLHSTILVVECGEALDPLLHLATPNQMVIKNKDGAYKMAYKHNGDFRAELRDASGDVKGVYSRLSDTGEDMIVSYISDKNGYRMSDLKGLDLDLPPLPYFLHPKAGQRKFPKEETENVEKSASKPAQKKKIQAKRSEQVLYPFGRLRSDLSAVVLEPHPDPIGVFRNADIIEIGDLEETAYHEKPFGALGKLPGLDGSQIDLLDGENEVYDEEPEPELSINPQQSEFEQNYTEETQEVGLGPPPPDNWPTQEGPANPGDIDTEVLALGPGVRPGVQQPPPYPGQRPPYPGQRPQYPGQRPQYPGQRPQYPAGVQPPRYPSGALSIQAIRDILAGSGNGLSVVPIFPGQPIAQIKPSATAIAEEGGMATAGPSGTAIVGGMGIAVSIPTSTAVVGPGGVAISAPSSSSQAGIGGIAIAGGQAIAIAGVQNPSQGLVQLLGDGAGAVTNNQGAGGPFRLPMQTGTPATGSELPHREAPSVTENQQPGFISARSDLQIYTNKENPSGHRTYIFPRVENYFINYLQPSEVDGLLAEKQTIEH